MTRAHKTLILAAVACLGVWGCAQGQAKKSANTEDRVKALEARCAKLEQEHKIVVQARDDAQRKIAVLEKERAGLVEEIENYKVALQERDELKVILATRTAERDAYATQFDELRKGMRTLLGRIETAIPTPPTGTTSSSVRLSHPKTS